MNGNFVRKAQYCSVRLVGSSTAIRCERSATLADGHRAVGTTWRTTGTVLAEDHPKQPCGINSTLEDQAVPARSLRSCGDVGSSGCVYGRERPPMNLGVALAECRSGRAELIRRLDDRRLALALFPSAIEGNGFDQAPNDSVSERIADALCSTGLIGL